MCDAWAGSPADPANLSFVGSVTVHPPRRHAACGLVFPVQQRYVNQYLEHAPVSISVRLEPACHSLSRVQQSCCCSMLFSTIIVAELTTCQLFAYQFIPIRVQASLGGALIQHHAQEACENPKHVCDSLCLFEKC